MGMFDSIYVRCPTCNERTELQSKAGVCELKIYTLDSAPPEILVDLDKRTYRCKNDHAFYLKVQIISHAVAIEGAFPDDNADPD
jgi:hypothetical protein